MVRMHISDCGVEMRNILLASVLLLANPVSAADLAASEPDTAFDWTGFYAGGHVGIGWGNADYTFANEGGDFPLYNYFNDHAGDTFSHRMNGGLAGLHAGYNQQYESLVLGLEGSFSLANVGKEYIQSPFYWDDTRQDTISTRLNWLAMLTPRLGYASDRWLVFAKGGLAYGQVRSRIDTYSDGGRFDLTKTFSRTGWSIGAGVNYAWTDNIILGLDYNYVDLGSFTVSDFMRDSGTGAIDDDGSTHAIDTAFHAIMARVSWQFN